MFTVRATIVAFLSEPVKGKPPVAVAGISEKSVLPLALNLRTTLKSRAVYIIN